MLYIYMDTCYGILKIAVFWDVRPCSLLRRWVPRSASSCPLIRIFMRTRNIPRVKYNDRNIIYMLCIFVGLYGVLTVAAQSKAWTVFARSNTGVVGSNPTRGMAVCVRLFSVYVVMCIGRGLATGLSPVQRVLPTVYRIKKLKKRPRPNKGL
jgi:hypothetical protein